MEASHVSQRNQEKNSQREERKRRKKPPKRYGTWNQYQFIYRMMWGYDKKLVFYQVAQILFSVVTPFLGVLLPAYVVQLLESGCVIREMILRIMGAFIIAGILCGIQAFLQYRNKMQYIEMRLCKCWENIFDKYLHLDYDISEKEKTGEMLMKAAECLSGNSFGMEGFLHTNRSLGTNLLGVFLYAMIITSVKPWLLLLLVGLSFLQFKINKRAQDYILKHRHEKAKIEVTQSYLKKELNEVNNGKDVRLYKLDDWLNEKYRKANRRMKKIVGKERRGLYVRDLTGLVFQFIRDVICYGYLIFLVTRGLSAAQFVLYLGVIHGFSTWFQKICENLLELKGSLELISDYREFLEIRNHSKHGDGIVLERRDRALEIVFDHVTFCYEGAESPVLENLSFHIKAGEKYALVGINGAGKSTIVKLIAGLYRPTKGTIYVNGIDITTLDMDEYWKELSVVFQNPFLYSFTIAENVAPQVTELIQKNQVEEALKKAGLWTKVSQLNLGVDTYINKDISENGVQLSGGEQQKLMLARAIYKNSQLLILDEPTAALDAIAESELYEQYNALLEGKTSLFISHRLASTRFCDTILFLENGKVVEQGSHEELMEARGSYYHMFEVQSQYYKEEGLDEVKEDMEFCI